MSSSLQTSYIRSMSQFCLTVAADVLKRFQLRNESIILLVSSQHLNSFSEHAIVQMQIMWEITKEVIPSSVMEV
jgi:hypothetical protein